MHLINTSYIIINNYKYIHACTLNSQCTSSEHSPRVAQLSTHGVSPLLTEAFVTNCPPLAVLVDLHTAV